MLLAYLKRCLAMVLLTLTGCGFTLQDINTGISAGRTFDDQRVFGASRTSWTWNLSGHYVRDKK